MLYRVRWLLQRLSEMRDLRLGHDADFTVEWDDTNGILKLVPKADDTGLIQLGTGSKDADFKVFLGSTSKYVLYDVGNGRVQFEGVGALLGDNDALVFGDGSDHRYRWNGSYFEAGPASGLWAGVPAAIPSQKGLIYHEFFDDFLKFTATDWDIVTVEAGSGNASEAVGDAVGGVLVLTNDDADDDFDSITYKTESFKLAEGKKLWFEARVKFSEATNADWIVGLIAHEDLSAVADNKPADGVVFHKEDGDTHLDFSHASGGNNDDSNSIATAAASYVRLGFYFDGGASGSATITPYVDGVAKTGLTSLAFSTAELAPYIAIRNGDANARNVEVDWVKVVQLR